MCFHVFPELSPESLVLSKRGPRVWDKANSRLAHGIEPVPPTVEALVPSTGCIFEDQSFLNLPVFEKASKNVTYIQKLTAFVLKLFFFILR